MLKSILSKVKCPGIFSNGCLQKKFKHSTAQVEHKTYDAIIIGSGIMGCSISLELARKGYKVISVDKNPAAGYGSTSYSCAIIRSFYSTLHGCALSWEGTHVWRNWAEHVKDGDHDRGLAEFRLTGAVVLDSSTNSNCSDTLNHFDTLGIPYEIWNQNQIQQKYPYLDLREYGPPRDISDELFGTPGEKTISRAYYCPISGYVNDPQLATYNLYSAAKGNGASFKFKANVVKINKGGNKVTGITLDSGEVFNAPIVINAAGPHSAIVNRLAGVEEDMNIKTRPLRQEVAYLQTPEDCDFSENGSFITDFDTGVYVRPECGHKMIVGSLSPDCDPNEFVDNPDDFNNNFTKWHQSLIYRCSQRWPTLPITNTSSGTVALYDVADDWIPIYDKSSLGGFFMAVGTSGNQFKNGNIVGKIMTDLIEYCEHYDHDLEPMIFPLEHTNYQLDMQKFSRLRVVDPNSSNTVIG